MKATHVFLYTGDGKRAEVAIRDFDTLIGSSGIFKYTQKNHKGKTIQVWEEYWKWNGETVTGSCKPPKPAQR